ncbi:GTP pyrophosphokinase [Cetobacterium sp.]|uniref:GTP pyrophosphokinase n=1 Tax=Cetobacterium sp. TaxID=2071632 RepID=UPI003F2D6C02
MENINFNQLQILNYYKKNRELYRKMGKRLERFLKHSFEKEKIVYHSITSRAKTRESFQKKLERKGYTSIDLATDLCGLRVITFLESETKIVENYLRAVFSIDESNSEDKSDNLGEDKVGYKTIHLVATLPENLLILPEFERFRDLKFEIQVRTILQHAWAEVEHDKNYKFSGHLPPDIKRRFKLLAGFLEIADREFESISKEISEYEKKVVTTIEGNTLHEIEINSTSLRKYLNNKFNINFSQGISPKIINLLHEKQINTLEDFVKIEDLEIMQKYFGNNSKKFPARYDLMIKHLLDYREKLNQ